MLNFFYRSVSSEQNYGVFKSLHNKICEEQRSHFWGDCEQTKQMYAVKNWSNSKSSHIRKDDCSYDHMNIPIFNIVDKRSYI